jgi:hypothetical protein
MVFPDPSFNLSDIRINPILYRHLYPSVSRIHLLFGTPDEDNRRFTGLYLCINVRAPALND